METEMEPESISTPIIKPKTFFWEIAQTTLIAFVLAQLLVRFVVQPHNVEGASMEPTFSNGDYILTDKITYLLRKPDRGEVVIFHPPQSESIEYIKRIIGLPGDVIEYDDRRILINGRLLSEPYLAYAHTLIPPETIKGATTITVPENNYYVLGDNRGNSYDSRYFGVIDSENIEGRAIVRYWPITEVKALTTPKFAF